MRKAVLITGANGFLARALARRFPPHWRPFGLVRPGTDLPAAGYEQVHRSLDAVAGGLAPDVVLHLAARIPDRSDPDPADLHAVNVDLVDDLLRRFPAARHVLASSVSVYGEPEALPLTVASPTRGATPYAASKIEAERRVGAVERNAILRFSSLIGPGRKNGSFVPTAVAGARDGVIRLHGDGSRLQDYLDIDDAAAMCARAADDDANFLALAVSGRAHANADVARLLAELTGARIEYAGTDSSPSFAYDLAGSHPLGVVARPLRATLARMLQA
jgi:UDP-glucose 4-epimerase